MSAPKKLRGGTGSELTRFKVMWRDTMAESARDFWRALFVSDSTQADIRGQLGRKLQIKLTRDDQLQAFRDWEFEQRSMDLEAERAIEEERRLIEEHPDWTKDQVREDLLRRFYNRARATGDAKLGLATMAQDRGLMQASTDREKFEFDAAAAALRHAAELKVISASKLSEADKVNAARKKLFGVEGT
jgi:hypothetical protein